MATKKKASDSLDDNDDDIKEGSKKKVDGFEDRSVKKDNDLLNQRTGPEDLEDTFILTDNVAFDIAVSNGRGLPVGAFIMIAAPKGTGKSTLCYDLIAKLLNKHKSNGIPFQAIHIDIEGSKSLANNFGLGDYIKSGDLIHITGPVTYTKLEKLYQKVIRGDEVVKNVKLVIIDSIANVTTDTMIDKSVEAGHFGLTAKAATEFFTKVTPYCSRHGVTTIMINHEKVDPTALAIPGRGTPKKEAGSDAAKYFSSVLLRLSKKTGANNDGINKHSVKTMQGLEQIADKFKVVLKCPEKNRFCNIGDVEMLVKSGKRIIDEYTIKNILLHSGLIAKSGNYYILDDIIKKPNMTKDKLSIKELNGHISSIKDWLIDYLRLNNLYRWDLDVPEEDVDGYQD